jgi:hypothetical protein
LSAVEGQTTTEAPARSRRPGGVALASVRTLSLTAVGVVNLAPGLLLGPVLDAAVFLLIGSAVRNGALPYRDYWDHKPPGAYLLNAAGQTAVPWLDRWLVDWLMTVAAAVVAMVILERLLRPRVGARIAWVATLVFACVVTAYPVALGGGYTESFALPLVMVALWLVARGDRGARSVAATGVVLAAACLFSLQAVPAALGIGLAMIVSTPRETVRHGLVLVAAGLVLPLAVIAWLAWGGALAAAWDQLVHYQSVYRSVGPGGWLAAFIATDLIALGCLLPPAVVTCVRIRRGRVELDRVMTACLGWVLAYAALVAFEQRLDPHYLILIAPALAVIGAPSLAWFVANLRAAQPRIRRAAFSLLAITAALTLMLEAWSGEWLALTPSSGTAWQGEIRTAAAWIDSHTAPSASVYVWGNYPVLYLHFDRTPQAPYLFQFPLTTAGYWSASSTHDLVTQWSQSGPDLIVEAPSADPLSMPAVSGADPRTYDVLDELRSFVKGNYRIVLDQADLRIWERIGPNG